MTKILAGTHYIMDQTTVTIMRLPPHTEFIARIVQTPQVKMLMPQRKEKERIVKRAVSGWLSIAF